ncbi:ribosome biogenesis protein SLX9-domain-containing protein [Obelidium mucronatum]|nr:ribosome biogenesis protein SLX9-domain-containing protein [Obelidium mucronatum]
MPRVPVERRHRTIVTSTAKPTGTQRSAVERTTAIQSSVTGSSSKGSVPLRQTADSGEGEELGSKKDKRVQRREKWLEKLSGVYTSRSIAEKRKKKVALFGVAADLQDIQGALEQTLTATDDNIPELVNDEAGQSGKKSVQAVPQKKKPVSQKARTKEGINEMLRLQSVMKHKAFKSNPLATIKTHLKNTL